MEKTAREVTNDSARNVEGAWAKRQPVSGLIGGASRAVGRPRKREVVLAGRNQSLGVGSVPVTKGRYRWESQ